MKTKYNNYRSQIKRVPMQEGESIEEQLRRLTAGKQPIPNEVPKIFTPSEEGVIGDYDIRQDRFDVAMEARDKFNRSQIAQGAGLGETEDNKQDVKQETNEE